ncbi:MAG: hypothetical protein JST69_12125 [Bacteroidetes bacterium]|nr:hypothetical protein [Bacteroidota bacterium]
MVQTKIKPTKKKLDLAISLPQKYVGKEVNVLFFTEDEIEIEKPKKKPSDYFGTLSVEEGEKFLKYLAKSRNEWQRSF